MHQSSSDQTPSRLSQALQLPLDFSSPVPDTRCGPSSSRYRSRTAKFAGVHRSPRVNDSSPVEVGTCAGATATPGPPSSTHFLPRFIRFRDAPRFFGMDKNRFNREIRPGLIEIRIGSQGKAFDRLEMEAAAEEYRCRNGRPAAHRRKPWDTLEDERLGSSFAAEPGTLIKLSTERAFAKALALATSGKRKHF